ncbi:MAG: esterase-like activity of phytase family protein [Paraprevotella sp.]|nr:esterase-like activity of phytase family protein [Paraprevotella sp.]
MAFTPDDSLVWVSGEADQRIRAYRMDGRPSGRELAVPQSLGLSAIRPNYGFEALTYDRWSGLFWTVTENALRADGPAAVLGGPRDVCLRLQSFGADGEPRSQYAYPLGIPQSQKQGRQYAFGAVALWACGDGRLWVMEREFNVPERRLKSCVFIRIYEVNPEVQKRLTLIHI